MRRLMMLMALVFIGVVGWRLVDNLSSDALSMGLGVLFGVMAGVPTALMVLVADRRREERPTLRRAPEYGANHPYYPQHYPHQPPVIVVTGQGMASGLPQPGYGAMPRYPQLDAPEWPRPERRYRLVGEQEEWVQA
jgi:hypothetical protein